MIVHFLALNLMGTFSMPSTRIFPYTEWPIFDYGVVVHLKQPVVWSFPRRLIR